MPLILPIEQYEGWLNGEDPIAHPQAFSAEALQWHAVSKRVNNAATDDEELVAPLGATQLKSRTKY